MGNFEQILERIRNNDTTLTELDLDYKRIGPVGAQAFATALETNNTLTELNLASNEIGPAGAQAIATALETNKTLTELHLADNEIGDLTNINNLIGRNQNFKKAIHKISNDLFDLDSGKNTPFPAMKDLELVCKYPQNCQRIVEKLLSKKLETHPEVDKTEIENGLVDDMKKSRLGTLILIFCKDNKYGLTMNDFFKSLGVYKNPLETNHVLGERFSNPDSSGLLLNKFEFDDVKHLIKQPSQQQPSSSPITPSNDSENLLGTAGVHHRS